MLKIDPKIKTKIKNLREEKTTISNISEKTGVSTPYVSIVLKEKLGNQYDNYDLRISKKKFSKQQKNTVVSLCKNGISLEGIEGITGIYVHDIQDILKEGLGKEIIRYKRGHHWEKYENGWLEEEASKVVELRSRGKSLKEIKEITNTSGGFVKKILIKSGEKDLKPNTWKHKKALTKEQILSKFKRWYYKVVRAMKSDSPELFESLKGEAIQTFYHTLGRLPQPTHKINRLIPVFVYSFFRTKGVTISFPLFKNLCGLTRHEIFDMLKKLKGQFPEYSVHGRKQVILSKINAVKSEFHFNYLFYKNADRILQKLWDILSSTIDRVVTGTVSALALISINNDFSINKICQNLEIKQSTVIYQVKKLVNKLNISGFTTMGKSKDLLCKVLDPIIK